MNLDQELQNYRKEIEKQYQSKKIIAQTIFTLQNAKQAQSKSNILSNLKKEINNKNNFNRQSIKLSKSPNRMNVINESGVKQFISPQRSISYLNVSPNPQKFSIQTPRDNNQNQSAVKLYSSKYQKILPNEQGNYYSMLQSKLDGLASLICKEDNYHENIKQLDDVIDQTINGFSTSKKNTRIEKIKNQKQSLQQDLQHITSKLSRLAYQKSLY